MISDDTEHALFVAQSLLANSVSLELFTDRLAWCLRWWFISLPAGIGLATARACIRLWLGSTPQRSGVFSAGNGPTMRAAPIGGFFSSSQAQLEAFTEASTRITHTDPRAFVGSKAVAVIAAWIVRDALERRPSPSAFAGLLKEVAPRDAEWIGIVSIMESGLIRDWSVDEFTQAIGQNEGVTGYVYHTVPVALFTWHRHFGDFAKTLTAMWECGGDTDTTGAIVGALAGATVGETGIPQEWIRGVKDWPRSTILLRTVADRLSDLKETSRSLGPVGYFWPGIVFRNLLFLFIVLFHGFRRLFPPY